MSWCSHVRVGTIVVNMMKKEKVATSKCSNFDSSTRNASSNGLCLVPSFFEIKEFLSSLFLSKICENFRIGFEIFSCSHRSRLTIVIITHQCNGALVPVRLLPGCDVRDVDRREVVQVSAIFFCPSVALLRISILFILLPPDHN